MGRPRLHKDATDRSAVRRKVLRASGGGEIKIGLDAADRRLLAALEARDDVSAAEAIRRAIRAAAAALN